MEEEKRSAPFGSVISELKCKVQYLEKSREAKLTLTARSLILVDDRHPREEIPILSLMKNIIKNEKRFAAKITQRRKKKQNIDFESILNAKNFVEKIQNAKKFDAEKDAQMLTGECRMNGKKWRFELRTRSLILTPHHEQHSSSTPKPERIQLVDISNITHQEHSQIIELEYKTEEPIYLGFNSLEDLQRFCEAYNNTLDLARELEDVDKFKIFILKNSEYLSKLHENLVINGVMSEKEFWSSRIELKEYEKIYNESKQQPGKSSGLLLNLLKKGREKIDHKLTEEEQQKILQQYPQVNEEYLKRVPNADGHINNEAHNKFWDEFKRLQKEFDTVIVGGKRPVVVGELTERQKQELRMISTKQTYGDLGEVDLEKNLERKSEMIEDTPLVQGDDKTKEVQRFEQTIERFINHAQNVMGGINRTLKKNSQMIDDEDFTMVKIDEVLEHSHKGVNGTKKMDIESNGTTEISSQKKIDGKMMDIESAGPSQKKAPGPLDPFVKHNYEKSKQMMNELLKSKDLQRNRRKKLLDDARDKEDGRDSKAFVRAFMDILHLTLISNRNIDSAFFKIYEDFNQNATHLLKLFYSILNVYHVNDFEDDTTISHKQKLTKIVEEFDLLTGKTNYQIEQLKKNEDKMKDKKEDIKVLEVMIAKAKAPLDAAKALFKKL